MLFEADIKKVFAVPKGTTFRPIVPKGTFLNWLDCQRSGLNVIIIRIPQISPHLAVQKQIIAQIEEAQKLVDANKKLIEIFEGRIKARIAELWG